MSVCNDCDPNTNRLQAGDEMRSETIARASKRTAYTQIKHVLAAADSATRHALNARRDKVIAVAVERRPTPYTHTQLASNTRSGARSKLFN